MLRLLKVLQFSTSLIAVCSGYPNASPTPQITPRPSVEYIKRDDSSVSSEETLVGWYTTASGAPWSINTCGSGSYWSTSGSYGACAPQTGNSLYTTCSGNWLVGGDSSVFSQQCVSNYPACTALYVAQDLNDLSPITYLICDVSQGLSRRSVFVTTTSPPAGSTAAASPASITTSASSAATTSTSPASAQTTSTPSPTPTNTPLASGLTGGQIAGTVIGIVGFFFLVAGAIFLWRRRRNAGLGRGREQYNTRPSELGADRDAKELPAVEDAKELPGDETSPVELPGSSPGVKFVTEPDTPETGRTSPSALAQHGI